MASYKWPPEAGGGVTTIDGLTGDVVLVAGTGISITDNSPVANDITIASTSAGDVTIGAFGSTPNANGLSISGSQVLNLQPADATHSGGLLSADWNTFNSKQNALTIGNLTDAGTDGITVTGGTGSVIGTGTSIAQHVADTTHNGYLSSTDWNTFNGKQASLTIGNLTDAGTDGITVTGGTGAVIGSGTSIAQHVADTTHNGYLSSTDWNTFSGKQASGNYITALTGDVTAAGPGSVAATLAATSNATLTTLSALTTAASLASVGTITSGTWSATTIALNKGGTGQTTKAAAFDALQPMTTGGDLIYGGASGTGTRLANGAITQVLQSAGGTLAPTWAYGGWKWIATQTASNSATIDFTGLDNTYSDYMVRFQSVKPGTDAVQFQMRIGTGVTPTYQSSGYARALFWVGSGGGSGAVASSSDSQIVLLDSADASTAAGTYISGSAYFSNPATGNYPMIRFELSFLGSGPFFESVSGGGYYGSATAWTALRFMMGSGNIASGTFRLYGLTSG